MKKRAKFSTFLSQIHSLRNCRTQWLRGLRHGSAACYECGFKSRWGHGFSVCVDSSVLLGRRVWMGLITRPEESYRVWRVWVWPWSLDKEENLAYKKVLRHGGKNPNYLPTELIFHFSLQKYLNNSLINNYNNKLYKKYVNTEGLSKHFLLFQLMHTIIKSQEF